jgi:hypothetical protein
MNPYDKLLSRIQAMTEAAERRSRKKGHFAAAHPGHAEAHEPAKHHRRKKVPAQHRTRRRKGHRR